MGEKILLAVEAMAEIDEMAAAAHRHGYRLRLLAEDPSYYGETRTEVVKFPTRNTDKIAGYIEERRRENAQVFSVTDGWGGVAASELRDKFGFYQFNDTPKLEFFRDKEKVQEALVNRGLTQSPKNWPRILKLKDGTGKLGVHLVESQGGASRNYKTVWENRS